MLDPFYGQLYFLFLKQIYRRMTNEIELQNIKKVDVR